ncbi:MAG: type II toxin-antitoxin system HicB family antitoxin [Armatimonadota bacterium]|nr:type II toxin-antitoxin system HicB family antitoxin [Armatimonadota bacterium]
MTKYQVVIYWSMDERCYIAEVPELPGCTADGATYEETLANVEVAIREAVKSVKAEESQGDGRHQS